MAQKTSRHENNLQKLLRGDVDFRTLTRILYSTDASIYQIIPQGVVFPKDNVDVSRLVQYARDNGLSLHPRGAGSGLSGDSLGTGLIVDFSRYYRRIREINPDKKYAIVEPGITLDELNREVAKYNLIFGPDPASGNRATFGGITANNSTGAHSLKYGTTRDHLESVDVILSDGSVATFGKKNLSDLPAPLKPLTDILRTNQEAIDRGYPDQVRNSAGYLLKGVLQNDTLDLAKLYAGSGGTLSLATSITVRLSDKPTRNGLLLLAFRSLKEAGTAVPVLLQSNPSSLELIDGQVITIARKGGNPEVQALLPQDAQAVLILEQDGESDDEVYEKIQGSIRLGESLKPLALKPALKLSDKNLIWAIRKSTTPLLYKNPFNLEPVEFIDDGAIPAIRLPEYFDGLENIFKKHELQCAFYGHAGHGELHLRPFMDFKKADDLRKMEQVADEFFELVVSLGGTISGEHGDGLLRAGFVPRQYPELFPVFKQIKETLDPENTFNPGKKIPAPDHKISDNLRYGTTFQSIDLPQILNWKGDEHSHETERCNGCGECKTLARVWSMCPVFKAYPVEQAAPRAKANLIRTMMSGRLSLEYMTDKEFKQIADLCANCKMCHLECPSEVNIPKLMLEARAYWVHHHGLPLKDRFLTLADKLSIPAGWTAPVSNQMMEIKPLRLLMQTVTGIHRNRKLPKFKSTTFMHQYKQSRPQAIENPVGKVAYFVDQFANAHDPELAWAVMDVLRYNDIDVIIPPQRWAAMPSIDYGDIKGALPTVKYNVKHLAEAVRNGYTIICSEPTATLCLKEEYPDVLEHEDVKLVSQHSMDIMEYLTQLDKQGKLKKNFKPVNVSFGYHAPCHLKALKMGYPGMELVQQIPGVKVEAINQGCCGIAGTFGFKARNFEISMKSGAPLFAALKADHIQFGLSECSTCKMQMEQGSGKKTIHPIKVLAAACGYPILELR